MRLMQGWGEMKMKLCELQKAYHGSEAGLYTLSPNEGDLGNPKVQGARSKVGVS